MTTRRATVIATLLILGRCAARAAEPGCPRPAPIGDGWTIADPAQRGFDADALCRAITSGVDPASNTHAVVVERGGRLVAESYFTGQDRPRGAFLAREVVFGPTTLHDLRSITKSVVGLLFGVALDQRRVASLDTPVLDYFPEHADLRTPERLAITLRHLLTMTAGLEWDESGSYARPDNSATRMSFAADRQRYVLERALVATPGERFVYNSGATQLLATVIERTTGVLIDRYAAETIFTPLGIDAVDWRRYADGRVNASGGLLLRPRDLAKIGRLLLAGGRWEGRQVVPDDWVREALQGRVQAVPRVRYGYQFWSGEMRHRGKTLGWSAAFGNGGQRLYLVAELDLVIVVTAGRYNEPAQGRASFDVVERVAAALAGP